MAGLSDYFGAILNKVFGNKSQNTEQNLQNSSGGFFGQISNMIGKIPQLSGSTTRPIDPTATSITPAPPRPSPTPTPTLAPQRTLQQTIESGLAKFSSPAPPIATMSAQLAQVGSRLPDQLLPTILALMETGGMQEGKTMTPNNPYNLGPGISYPDPATAILGGGDQIGLNGILRNKNGGLYQDYLDSGDLSQFFSKFTPESDPRNPSTDELVRRYKLLEQLFQ